MTDTPATKRKPRPKPTFEDVVRRAGWWYIGGCAAVGFALGWFVGMSNTPVVAAVLPLILAAIGGASGFMIARSALDSLTAVWRLKCVGGASLAFALLAVLGAVVGLSVRHGHMRIPGWGTVEAKDDGEELDLTGLPTRVQARLIAIREHLDGLGVARVERDAVVEQARKTFKDHEAAATAHAAESKTVTQFASTLATWAGMKATEYEEDSEERAYLDVLAAHLQAAVLSLEEAETESSVIIRDALRFFGHSAITSMLNSFEYEAPGAVNVAMMNDDEARRARAILVGREAGNYSEDPVSSLDSVIEVLTQTRTIGPVSSGSLRATPSRGLASNGSAFGMDDTADV